MSLILIQVVSADEAIANEAASVAKEIKEECEGDLAEALPALEAAMSALNTLKPSDISMVKTMKVNESLCSCLLMWTTFRIQDCYAKWDIGVYNTELNLGSKNMMQSCLLK